jgi:DNA-binding CsgD family transcriptional regulator
MNNLFSALMTPLVHRPGDAGSAPPPPRRREREAPPRGTRYHRIDGRTRRPNAGLPEVPNPWDLTRAEVRAIQLCTDGKSTEEVAAEMGLAVKTIEHYYKGVREKMGVTRIRAAVLWDRFIRGDAAPEVRS